MNCPHCKVKLSTRKTFDAETFTHRIKWCPECKRYFKTWERRDHGKVEMELKVLKRRLRNIRNIVLAK